jgi:hypothetical protein
MAVLASILVAACMAASPPPPANVVAEKLVFNTSLTKFVQVADSKNRDKRLTWTTDGCSVPVLGSTGRTFDFYNACRRHDFAYRNIGKLDGGKWWTPEMRAKVDGVFKKDMLDNCKKRPKPARTTCSAWAETFYSAVRVYAGP